jgi:SAM-dependent methyltransferase
LRPAAAYLADDGAAYERFLGRWTGRLAQVLIDFAALPGDGPVLDVGCGTGSVAFELRRRFPDRSVSAVDVSSAYPAFAQGRDGGRDIRFELADAARLPFEAGAFAGAITQLALYFMPDPGRAVLEMRRVTRGGGVLAAAVWDFRGGLVCQRLFWDTAAAIDPQAAPARDRLFSHPLAQPGGLAGLWQASALRDVKDGSLTIRMDYASFADYWEPLLGGQGPFGSYALAEAEEEGSLPSIRTRRRPPRAR